VLLLLAAWTEAPKEVVAMRASNARIVAANGARDATPRLTARTDNCLFPSASSQVGRVRLVERACDLS
jgi:hypothetical protein